MTKAKVGIVGFGVVGTVMAKILERAGVEYGVYDVLMDDPVHRHQFLNKAEESKVPVSDLPALIREATYLVSTVTTQAAEEVARMCLPHLAKNQFFVDCNSTSPTIKINIGNIIQASEANFIEGVILNAVNPGDIALDMLIGGTKGVEAAAFLQGLHTKARFYGEEVGKASMFKMLRSIFSKGVEALLLEMRVTAKKAGIDRELWKEITTFMDSKPFEVIGETWVRSHAGAYDRRFHEMEQVIETMKELGTKPLLTAATAQYFKQSMDLDLKSFFPVPPGNADEVIAVIAQQSSSNIN